MPSETDIRDALASDPSVLEGGLTLVEVEHHLPNASGTRGFIDILAKDRYGNFVVIEIKRSDNSAARALHELFKYAELLARERGLAADRVRCMLVSTAWNELLVPFSLLSRTFSYDTVGVSIDVDDRGRITSADLVSPLEEAPLHGVTPVQMLFGYATTESREQAWLDFSALLTSAGCSDHVAFLLDGSGEFTDAPFGLYVILGRTPPTSLLDHMRDEVPDDSIEAPDGCVWEYRALCTVMKRYRGAAWAEPGYPDKLAHLVHQSGAWTRSGTRRAGAFAAQTMVTDNELLREASISGASDTSFGALMSPARPTHWAACRHNIDRVLLGTPEWSETISLWLDEMATTYPRADVAIAIFNPCDVIGSIVNTVTDEDSDSMPSLELQVIVDGEVERVVHGTLVWDNDVENPDLGAAFDDVYGDVMRWGIARNFGETWVFDLDLCRQTGLAYACVEFRRGEEPMYRLRSTLEGLQRQTGDPSLDAPCGMRPLNSWLAQNRDALGEIVGEMSEQTLGIFRGLD